MNEKIKKQCPVCGNWDVIRAFVEDGGMGDWCPHCNKSLEKRTKPVPFVLGLIIVLSGLAIMAIKLMMKMDLIKF